MMVTIDLITMLYISCCFASGGYVGLFVGYTISQAPILLINFIAGLKTLLDKLKLMRYQTKVEAQVEVEEQLGEEV